MNTNTNQKQIAVVLDCLRRCQHTYGCEGCAYGKRTTDAGCASLLLADAEKLIRMLNLDANRAENAKRLRDWMEYCDLNYTQAGALLGINNQRCNRYARNLSKMPEDVVERLNRILEKEGLYEQTEKEA